MKQKGLDLHVEVWQELSLKLLVVTENKKGEDTQYNCGRGKENQEDEFLFNQTCEGASMEQKKTDSGECELRPNSSFTSFSVTPRTLASVS